MAKLYINEKNRKGKINPEIYGHFSEHLGRCIYEGLYVGENSDIPNENGMRKDVVEALKEMQRYVKKNGFVTPDKKYTVADVVLREREATGKVISITPYHKLFNTITDELLK